MERGAKWLDSFATRPLNSFISFFIMHKEWHHAIKSTSAFCSVLTILCNYLHTSEPHHTQSYRPSINVTVKCFAVGKENHCLADVFRHNLFRRNEFGRNIDLDAAKHSDGYSTTILQGPSPYRSRPTMGTSTHFFYQPGGCILCYV